MIRVFLVDDHSLFRAGMKALLAVQSDYTVVGEASAASEGFKMLEQTACDLVLVDYQLPDHEGPWLVSKLRKRFPELPTLVVSQFTEPARVRRALESGCNGYVVKAAEEPDLLIALRVVAAGGIYVHPLVAPILLRPDKDLDLSERELQTIGLVAEGLSNQQIADSLHVSLGTVKRELSFLYERFSVSDRAELVTEALARGLVSNK